MAIHSSSAARIHPRRALLIGNISYPKNPLTNCVHDAEDLAEILRRINFKVDLGINLKYREMDSKIRTFAKSIQEQDLVLFYFAGHGFQNKAENYRLPVDADEEIQTENDIESNAVNAQRTLGRLASRTSFVTVFILDCCRTYWFDFLSRSRGPSQNGTVGLTSMSAPGGTLLQFACAPSTVAEDGY